MDFELRIVRNNPLTGERNLDQLLTTFLRQIGYLPSGSEETAPIRLFKDCFLLNPEKAWTIDEMLTMLETNRSTLYRYLNKLKGLDLLDEIDIPADEKIPNEERYRKVRKGYRFRFQSFSIAWGIVESHASVAMENYRKTVDHIEELSKEILKGDVGSRHHDSPSIAVDGVVLRGSGDIREILLVERGRDPFKGIWALPGGFIEKGETAEEAVLREIREETGVDCEIKTLASVASKPDRDPRGHTISIIYFLEPKGDGKPRGGDDASDARWFELDGLPHLAFDHEDILKDLKRRSII